VQTEFAFDVNQLSKLRFAPSAYLRYVGLNVPNTLLRKAFFETYGLDLPDIIGTRQATLRVYRFAARRFLPNIARAEVVLHKKSFPADVPSPELDTLTKDLLQASADNDWERFRNPPGIGTHIFAGFIYILPKVGALKLLAIQGPQVQTEDLYIKSVNHSINSVRYTLAHFDTIQRYLPNRDLDTGFVVKPGGYRLTDETFARLLEKLAEHSERPIPAQVKHDIIAYYANPNAPIITKKTPRKWREVQDNLATLKSMKTIGNLNPVFDAMDAQAAAAAD